MSSSSNRQPDKTSSLNRALNCFRSCIECEGGASQRRVTVEVFSSEEKVKNSSYSDERIIYI